MRAVEDAHEGRRLWFGKTFGCEVNELCIAKRPLKSSRRRCEIADGGHSTYVLQWWQSPIKYVCYFRTRVAISGFLRQRNSKSLAYDNLNRQHRCLHWITEYYACYTTEVPFKIKQTIDIQSVKCRWKVLFQSPTAWAKPSQTFKTLSYKKNRQQADVSYTIKWQSIVFTNNQTTFEQPKKQDKGKQKDEREKKKDKRGK